MKALAVVSAALFVLAGCVASPERSQMREAQDRAICQSSGFAPGTYGFTYCMVKTAYLRYVAGGSGSQAGSFAAVSIENNRQRCLDRVDRLHPELAQERRIELLVAQLAPTLGRAKLDQVIAGARRTTLPQLIEELGSDEGLKEFLRQMEVVMRALFLAAGLAVVEPELREECNQAAVNEYREWLPVLLQSDPSRRFSYDDFQRRSQLDRIEGELRQMENRQRQIEQQQRNMQGQIQN